MNLTKTIRIELAGKLAIKAIEKHAAKMGSEAERIAAALEAAHLAHLADLMPEIPQSRYPDLIRCGVVTATLTGPETVYSAQRKEDGSLSSSSENPGRAKVGKVNEDGKEWIQGSGLKNGKWSKFFDQFYVSVYSHSMEAYVYMEPKLSQSLPDFRGRSYVHLTALEPEKAGDWSDEYKRYAAAVAPLFDQIKALAKEAAEILGSAIQYRDEVLDLLQACRTDKQLRELFPEAADLLPAPAVKTKALAPIELAAKVRQRLKEGVPA